MVELLIKAFIEILREFGGYGLFLFLWVCTVVVLVRLLMQDRKKREEDVEKYVKVIEGNGVFLRETAKRLKECEDKLNPFVERLNARDEAERLKDAVRNELRKRDRDHDTETY